MDMELKHLKIFFEGAWDGDFNLGEFEKS